MQAASLEGETRLQAEHTRRGSEGLRLHALQWSAVACWFPQNGQIHALIRLRRSQEVVWSRVPVRLPWRVHD